MRGRRSRREEWSRMWQPRLRTGRCSNFRLGVRRLVREASEVDGDDDGMEAQAGLGSLKGSNAA